MAFRGIIYSNKQKGKKMKKIKNWKWQMWQVKLIGVLVLFLTIAFWFTLYYINRSLVPDYEEKESKNRMDQSFVMNQKKSLAGDRIKM